MFSWQKSELFCCLQCNPQQLCRQAQGRVSRRGLCDAVIAIPDNEIIQCSSRIRNVSDKDVVTTTSSQVGEYKELLPQTNEQPVFYHR